MRNSRVKNLLTAIKSNLALVLIFLLLLISLFSFTEGGKTFWTSLYNKFNLTGLSSLKDTYPINIYFFDVGKADSILIECGGEYALIDAGTYTGGDDVCTYLTKLGVKEIKTLFASHPDKDHIGGMSKVIENFTIGSLVQSDIDEETLPSSEEYKSFISAAEKYNLNQEYAEVGRIYTIGEATLTVIAPVSSYEDTNNSSIVLKLEYQGFSVLFCGDIEEEAEYDILNSRVDLSADVLKVAHHGSKTSSTQEFLEAVNPKYAVISTGEDNNKLPKKSVLERIEAVGAEIYRTDIDGYIICSFDGNNIIFETEK